MAHEDLRTMTEKQILDERTVISREYAKAVGKAKEIHTRLGKIKHELRLRRKTNEKPFVSDHAVLRYLERVNSVDIEALRETIASKIPDGYLKNRIREYSVDGITYALSEDFRCVTTVIDPELPKD